MFVPRPYLFPNVHVYINDLENLPLGLGFRIPVSYNPNSDMYVSCIFGSIYQDSTHTLVYSFTNNAKYAYIM